MYNIWKKCKGFKRQTLLRHVAYTLKNQQIVVNSNQQVTRKLNKTGYQVQTLQTNVRRSKYKILGIGKTVRHKYYITQLSTYLIGIKLTNYIIVSTANYYL